MLGTRTVSIFDHNGKFVVKMGQCGDGFGYVMEVSTRKEFEIYGYNHLVPVGTITLETSVVSVDFIKQG